MNILKDKFQGFFAFIFLRNLYINFALLFVNAAVISSLGTQFYARIFSFTAFLSIIFYCVSLWVSQKKSEKIFLVLTCISPLLNISLALSPNSHAIMIANISCLMMLDVIGPTMTNNMLVNMSSPAVYMDLYQKSTNVEMISRIVSTFTLWLVSHLQLLTLSKMMIITFAFSQAVLFTLSLRTLQSGTPVKATKEKAGDRVLMLKNAGEFLWKNRLLRTALILALWGSATKFLIEYVFLNHVETRFVTHDKVSEVLSFMQFSVFCITLGLQKVGTQKIFQNYSLSKLNSLLPVGVFALGIVLLIYPHWVLAAMLMLWYQVINRSVFMPISRQSFTPVPGHLRKHVLFIVAIFTVTSSMMMSSLLSSSVGKWESFDQILFLLFNVGLSFFVITQFDAKYIRNVWNYWLSENNTFSTQGYFDVPPRVQARQMASSTHIKMQSLRKFAHLIQNSHVEEGMHYLENLLHSSQEKDVFKALEILFVANLEGWIEGISSLAQKGSPELQSEFQKILRLHERCEELSLRQFPSSMRRQFRELLFLNRNQNEHLEKLFFLITIANRKTILEMVEILESFSDEVESDFYALWDCMNTQKRVFTFLPFLSFMVSKPFNESELLREKALKFSGLKETEEIEKFLNRNLTQFYKERYNIWKHPFDSPETQKFLHLLFIAEWLMLKDYPQFSFLMASFEQCENMGEESLLIFIRMHMEFLKHHPAYEVFGLFLHKHMETWQLKEAVKKVKEL